VNEFIFSVIHFVYSDVRFIYIKYPAAFFIDLNFIMCMHQVNLARFPTAFNISAFMFYCVILYGSCNNKNMSDVNLFKSEVGIVVTLCDVISN
jgi:hypothetical protein